MLKGELAALAVAVCWTFTSLFFEAAGKRLGSLSVNFIRLLIALILFTIYSMVFYGKIFPEAETERYLWLAASGVIGFFIGDLFLFKAFILIGSRLSMLMMSLAPVFAAVLAYVFIDEVLLLSDIAAIIITVFGIAIVVLTRNSNGKIVLSRPFKGFFYALIGALGQAGGLILSKKGVTGYDPFLATDIRVMAGLASFGLLIIFLGQTKKIFFSYKDIRGVGLSTCGAFLGPFAGVSLSLYSVKHIHVGIASTIMAIVPVLLIPVSMVLYREKVKLIEAAGIVIAVAGVAVLFLGNF